MSGLWLFSYGTLRQAQVQRAVFGRELECIDDVLTGFEMDMVTIVDPLVIEQSGSDRHPILRQSGGGNAIAGSALSLNAEDLEAADRYEAADYERVRVSLASGREAFVYVYRDRRVESPQDVHLVTPGFALLERLLPVARRIFADTFSQRYDEAAFEKFCDDVYLPDGTMARDFAAPGVFWQVATADGAPIGYAKMTPLRASATDPAQGSLELQQVYLLSEWHGTGVADRLMEWAIKTAHELAAPELYLTVFDHNERAKRFYTRHGFEDVGQCTFQLGDRIDDDRIWRRGLAEAR